MPHFQIDYSANLKDVVDMGALCEAIRAAAAGIETFPVAGIRVRAVCVDHVAIADGDPKHGFIDLSIRLREGRPDDIKKSAVADIFEVMKSFVAPAMESHSIALSAEMRDIDAGLSPKFGNIRDHLEDTA
ncbi:5-carboxymethyl-2-hydroxymuconate delta isomerase [Sulfitobacter noctilucicola]|uniref:5-carboxymethyl-2-hydroxymuconate isomerase n=1 Tax=Sulfitobacter noctilucicola TaxID=1342301 RepID=A0A7W6Q4C3_9RHOB|nr:5-carboxymethyl-2-hydroxymuconate Delta-isomerase [Sulfitobacter noctilucicola]KIN62705.1 5-carboxymethyl-2-hydroxymuconate delta isomerase [Sulfitobacter noctilucicola]MBB4172762.1 5-carboxymethyl-2-hydroxymuconate isomerase [Sulfitobacter noctilucicola]